MISSRLIMICSYSIVIAVVIGLIRFRKISRAYHPFIFILIIGLANEMLREVLIRYYRSNAIGVNSLSLCTSLLWIVQFKKWGGFANAPKKEFAVLLGTLIALWLFENVFLGRIGIFSSLFSLVSSFIIVFLAIDQVNKLIVEERDNLLKNASFLICTGVLIFHTYKIMVESFYVMKLNESTGFLSKIFIILVFVNLFVNLLFALATIWIPTRQRFTMQY